MDEKNKDLLYGLQLALSENVGPTTFRQLLSFFKSPETALQHLSELANHGGKRQIKICPIKAAEAQISRLREICGQIIGLFDKDYPQSLKQINDAPPFLFTLGNIQLLNQRCVAIVGTRNASINGKNMAQKLGYELLQNDICVVSGMARGIDRAAHCGALSNMNSKAGTIAVLGTPVDEIYPKENTDIYNQIKERGCLISEFPFGTQLAPTNFPRRNRIISGLSEGVVVIEAQLRSGSLITAHEALNQGREVMAVPGFPADPRSMGPNNLIKEGATLITNTQDIMDTINQNHQFKLSSPMLEMDSTPDFHSLESEVNSARDEITNALSAEAIEIDALVRQTGIPMPVVNIVLVELELAGRLERHRGNKVSLIYGG